MKMSGSDPKEVGIAEIAKFWFDWYWADVTRIAYSY